jgi:hypothetical protein
MAGLLAFGASADTSALLGLAAGGSFAMLGLGHVAWLVWARAHRMGRTSLVSEGGRPR